MRLLRLITSFCVIILVVILMRCGDRSTKKDSIIKSSDSIQSLSDDNVSSFKSGYSLVNGIKMYYEIHGAGKTLVLIHGGGSTIQTTFGRILPILAKSRQIIAIELQAHGHTEDRNVPESFEQDADDVAALLKNLTISKADFLGFSNGGNTAMQIAIRHPELVEKLVVASSFYKKDGLIPGFFEGLKRASLDNMPALLKTAYLHETPDTARLKIMFKKDRERMMYFKDWSDKDIKLIVQPTLLVVGDEDVVLPEHAVAMSHVIPHCRLAIIPGGHGKYLGEITTLTDGKWTQKYVISLIEQFLDTSNI